MEFLTLQAFLNNTWVDIANITFPGSEQNNYRLTELNYHSDYAIDNLDRDDNHAASLNHPVSLFFDGDDERGWLKFLDDIIPSGSSRRYWANYLDLEGLTADQQNFILLKHGTLSPVGNLRIKESAPGVTLYHEETLRALIDKISHSHMVTEQGFDFDIPGFVTEWVRRDLLNIIFGNSDNHGRNTSFLKDERCIRLAPIYDFAPMKADPEGIARTTKWKAPLEIGGEYDYPGIAQSLDDLVPAETLLSALKNTSHQLSGLKERLEARGIPQQILNMPAISFSFIPEKLRRWGLL